MALIPARAVLGIVLVVALAMFEIPVGLAQSVSLPLKQMRRRSTNRGPVVALAQVILGVCLTVWHAAGNVVNVTVNVPFVAWNEALSLLTLSAGARFYLGTCECSNSVGRGRIRRFMLVVEGGVGMRFLAALRVIMAGRPLWGTSIGNVIYTQDVKGVWMEHECGHTEQARLMGVLYVPLGAVLTMTSHRFEAWASRLGLSYEVRGPF